MKFIISAIMTLMTGSCMDGKKSVNPPVADKIPKDVGMHGDKRIDNYYWMNDYFKKGPLSDKVVSYLEAENKYTDAVLSDVKDLRDTLFNEMKSRIKQSDQSVPVFKNGYYYYNRFVEDKQYAIYCRRKASMDSPEIILLNLNEMAKGHAFFEVEAIQVSPDNKLLAFAVDTLSRRQYSVHIKNLETGDIYPDAMYPASPAVQWANDSKTIFYTANDPNTLLSEKINRHVVGSDSKNDLTVYEEKDKSTYLYLEKLRSQKFIVIRSESTMSSEVFYLDANTPDGEFKVFQPRMKDVKYTIDEQDDRFLILTNLNAKNFRLMEAAVGKPSVDNWKEMIPHRTDVLLEHIYAFHDFYVVTERKDGLVKVNVHNEKPKSDHYIDFDEPAFKVEVSDNPEFYATQLRYQYTSLKTPFSEFDYDMASRSKKLLKEQEVTGGYNKEDYVTERLFAVASDGVKVPVSLVYKKGFKKDGKSPLVLYGYGSYGYSADAAFASHRLSLLNRGFAYAIAHIRGGQEMGREWYENGKLMKKKNTFTDFIAAAEYLVNHKITSPENLYASGGSAGGLLMGAIINMKPHLWKGVVAEVPFVDVVTTMLDESIPLTTNEFDEWGNPKNKDAYEYMKSYSPYDNVAAVEYPNLLVITGLHDSQVQYFEPAKWVAKMREMKKGDELLLLQTNMDYGHGGASGRFDYLKKIALMAAFFLKLEKN
ncbi:MAG TPA: S9 family peptidase [Flavitalea sp.]|nr:S9 family peptidase [Flavitalea sp.]